MTLAQFSVTTPAVSRGIFVSQEPAFEIFTRPGRKSTPAVPCFNRQSCQTKVVLGLFVLSPTSLTLLKPSRRCRQWFKLLSVLVRDLSKTQPTLGALPQSTRALLPPAPTYHSWTVEKHVLSRSRPDRFANVSALSEPGVQDHPAARLLLTTRSLRTVVRQVDRGKRRGQRLETKASGIFLVDLWLN